MAFLCAKRTINSLLKVERLKDCSVVIGGKVGKVGKKDKKEQKEQK